MLFLRKQHCLQICVIEDAKPQPLSQGHVVVKSG